MREVLGGAYAVSDSTVNRSALKTWGWMFVALAGAAGMQSARASTCTQLQPTHTGVWPLDHTNWSGRLVTIPKFNPADGTLCMVVVRMSASLNAQLLATNNTPSAATLTATMHVNANIQAPAPIANFSAQPISAMQTLSVPSNASSPFGVGPIPSDAPVQHFLAQNDLNQFIGAGGLLFFSASATGDVAVTLNSGNASVAGTPDASADVKVEYWISVIPEPATPCVLTPLAIALRRPRKRR